MSNRNPTRLDCQQALAAFSSNHRIRRRWNPSDLYKIDMPQEMLEKQKQKAF